jgi:hypothetical protein
MRVTIPDAILPFLGSAFSDCLARPPRKQSRSTRSFQQPISPENKNSPPAGTSRTRAGKRGETGDLFPRELIAYAMASPDAIDGAICER